MNRQPISSHILIIILQLCFFSNIYSEGMGSFGGVGKLSQQLRPETIVFVHTSNDNQIVRVHLTDEDGPNTKVELEFYNTIINSSGEYEISGATVSTVSSPRGNIDENHNMVDTLPALPTVGNALEYIAPIAGVYGIKFISHSTQQVTRQIYKRWDIAVVDSASETVDPGESTGEIFSYDWQFYTQSFDKAAGTTGKLFTLVPGGYDSTNYVWTLDLQDFSGNGYRITANSTGLDAPYSGYSQFETATPVPIITPKFPVYLNYPQGANPGPEPTVLPDISDQFVFISNDASNNVISPNGDNIQDAGSFQFTPTATGTYSIILDIDEDGVFGNANDRILLGEMTEGVKVAVPWSGEDEDGTTVTTGTYSVKLSLRLGEYHFVTYDTETSGDGADNGLTIFRSPTDSTLAGTLVYWEDKKYLNGISVMPNGEMSEVGVPSGTFRHSWGNWANGGIGNESFIDTYVFGLSNTPSNNSVTVIDESGVQHTPEITDTIADQNVLENFKDYTIDLNTIFSDSETIDSNLIFTITSDSLVDFIIVDGIVTISSKTDTFGVDTILFTSTDESGLYVTDTVVFIISEDTPPIVDSIADQDLIINFTDYDIDLNEKFSDDYTADSNLVFTVTSDSLVDVVIVDGVVTITNKDGVVGVDTLYFTATDENGGSTTDTVVFTIIDDTPPKIVDSIVDQNIVENFDDYIIDLNEVFDDSLTNDSNFIFYVESDSLVEVTIVDGIATVKNKQDSIGIDTVYFITEDESGLKTIDTVVFTILQDKSNHDIVDFDLGHIEIPEAYSVQIIPNPSRMREVTVLNIEKPKTVDRITVKIFSNIGKLVHSGAAEVKTERSAIYKWSVEEKTRVSSATSYIAFITFYDNGRNLKTVKRLLGIKQ